MFYSHQLLARKAPLGQIWMAATMHEKMNRKKLDKLNITKICEEILYPTVPMALRLSGILMGGVVIVYERKVKLLYDDVNRLLVELNEAWKVKAAPSDPTRLPKNKTQAKYDAVTLPRIRAEDLEEMEQSVPYPVMDFQRTSYISMRLDSVDDPNLFGNNNEDRHQVNAANITLEDNYDPHQADTHVFDRFERFDIEGYEDFSPADLENPTSLISNPPLISTPPPLISTPPPPAEPNIADEIQEQYPEDKVHQQSNESKDANKVLIKKRAARATRRAALIMDNRQTVIPGEVYQTWLKNPSDVKRERKQKKPEDALSTFKIHTLLNDLPSIVLSERLFTSDLKIHYPTELLRDWLRITQSPHDSPSGRASAPKPPEPSASSLPEATHFMGPMQDTFEDYDMGAEPQSPRISIERQRRMVDDNNEPPERLIEMLRYNLRSKGLSAKETDGVGTSKSNPMATPANSGDDIRSIPSSGSGNGFPSQNSNVNSGSRKRPFSAINISPNGLEPVAEELSWGHPEFKLKVSRVSGCDTPNDELMVETGPTQTQTQKPQSDKQQPPDPVTEAVREQLKNHFETPGKANIQSLLELACGMNRKGAARLFYQTCVLATRECIRVQQIVPYGDILISRGLKM